MRPKIIEGEWVEPIKKDYQMECCDCGLVHKMDFKVMKKQVYFRCHRDNRATAQTRRREKIKVIYKDE